MEINNIRTALSGAFERGIDFYERRPGKHQLIIPILHEDGDMVDIYLEDSPKGEGYIRICDFGMTLMRLSYTFDLNTATRQSIFESILINSGVNNSDGNLYLDTPVGMLYEGIMQFAGCVQKVCNMSYWSRETVRNTFYEDLRKYVTSDLTTFEPKFDQRPLGEYPVNVDWLLTCNKRPFYLFGVPNNDKAKNVTICLLEFQKAELPYISLIVHQNMEELGSRERQYLTRNADRQYPLLSDFKEKGASDIRRFAPA